MGDLAVASYLDEVFDRLPDVLTVQQLADALGRDRRTIRRWLVEDTLPGWPVGDGFVIWRDEVKRRLDDNRRALLERAAAGEIPEPDPNDLGLAED